MIARLLKCILVFTAVFAVNLPAMAQVARVELTHPLPEQIRERAETMVRILRPRDAESAVAHLRTDEGAARHFDLVILRIEAECRNELCITVIARNETPAMVPELILNAGTSFYVSDELSQLWGMSAWQPIYFQGANCATLSATRRGDQWVVEACAACISWSNLHNEPLTQDRILTADRASPAVPMRFEDFRTAIGR